VPGEDHSGIIAPFAIGPSLGLCIALLRLLAEHSGLKFGWYNFLFVPQLFGVADCSFEVSAGAEQQFTAHRSVG